MINLKYQRLEERIGYSFQDQRQLQLALTHRSHGATNNERLEFLGDSILNFVIGDFLFKKFPEAREGQMSRLRSQLVKGETLAELAVEFALGECLILGEGELKSGGRSRDSILADSVEAIIGAIYLESGITCVTDQPLPEYRVINIGGEGHAQVFTIECHVTLAKEPTQAVASNRREAEKKAATAMLQKLKV